MSNQLINKYIQRAYMNRECLLTLKTIGMVSNMSLFVLSADDQLTSGSESWLGFIQTMKVLMKEQNTSLKDHLDESIQAVEQNLKSEISSVQQDLKTSISEVKQEILEEIMAMFRKQQQYQKVWVYGLFVSQNYMYEKNKIFN